MPTPVKVTGHAFYTPHWEGEGFIVWARIGGSWQRYSHTDTEDNARRLTSKTHARLKKCAAMRAKEEAPGG